MIFPRTRRRLRVGVREKESAKGNKTIINKYTFFFNLHPHNVLHEENGFSKRKKGFLGHIHECRFARLCQNSYCFQIASKMIQPIKKIVEKAHYHSLGTLEEFQPLLRPIRGESFPKVKLCGEPQIHSSLKCSSGRTIQQSRDLKTTTAEIIVSLWK